MRAGRIAGADQPARIFPGMFAVSGMRFHSGHVRRDSGGGSDTTREEPWDEKCPLDGNGLVKKHGRFGEFIGCSGYPKCKYTRPITMGIKCTKCNEGEFVKRGSMGKGGRGRFRVFYGCSRYPACDFTTP